MEKDENFLLDPNNIPGIDYYLDIWKEPNGKHHYNRANELAMEDGLTIEGFCEAANALAKPFGEAYEKARKIMYAK